jgi:sec-independent protein translocase protein TatB
MFDIGFSELMVIGLVALIVIGPERLPRVARTIGHLTGRLQRYVADVKADINREVELDELRKMKDSVQQAASGFENSVQGELNKTESELNAAANPEATPDAATAASPPEAPRIPEKIG